MADTPYAPLRHRVVVFIDMLGFSALVDRLDEADHQYRFRDLHFSSLEELDRELAHLSSA
jgi:hypothetical protein